MANFSYAEIRQCTEDLTRADLRLILTVIVNAAGLSLGQLTETLEYHKEPTK
jgi:hypothetical protein